MNIYDANNQLVLAVEVDDESYRYRAICGENELTLKYSLAVHVELPVGAYCDYQGHPACGVQGVLRYAYRWQQVGLARLRLHLHRCGTGRIVHHHAALWKGIDNDND